MKNVFSGILSLAACIAIGSVAYAIVTVDQNGVGFAGKGDVQVPCGMNNQALQAWGNGSFRYADSSVVVTEQEWICTNSNNQNEQFRERTTTTTSSTTGLLSAQARVKNQITGYHLSGFSGLPVTSSSSTTQGNQLNSCPSGPWSLTTPAGEPVVISNVSTQVVEVECSVGSAVWTAIN